MSRGRGGVTASIGALLVAAALGALTSFDRGILVGVASVGAVLCLVGAWRAFFRSS